MTKIWASPKLGVEESGYALWLTKSIYVVLAAFGVKVPGSGVEDEDDEEEAVLLDGFEELLECEDELLVLLEPELDEEPLESEEDPLLEELPLEDDPLLEEPEEEPPLEVEPVEESEFVEVLSSLEIVSLVSESLLLPSPDVPVR